VEIIARGERRCSRSLEQKHGVVAVSLGPENDTDAAARKHAVSSGQLYTWRQRLLGKRDAVIVHPGKPDL
jgi:transposase-like protein